MINEISIIIPTLNEAKYLPKLLSSIAGQTYAGSLQVIIVDGHSEDTTVEIAKTFKNELANLKIIDAKRNIGHQRNVGAEYAIHDYLLFLDADVVLPPKMLDQLSKKVKTSGPIVAGVLHTAEVMSLQDRLFLRIIHLLVLMSWAIGSPATNGDFILTTRANHRNINGFAEGTILGEDIDYGIRSLKSGAKNRFFFSPRVIASPRRVRLVGRWRLLLFWSRGYLHVLKHGPIYPGQGFDEYTFGHYEK